MAMALFSLAILIGPAIGPTLGGMIVDNWAWPWIFYINLPVGLLGLVMVSTFVKEPEDILAANRSMAEKQRKNMDWAGIALLSVAMSALQYVLEEGERNDWFDSRLITVLTVVAVVGIAAFVIRELTAPVPAVDLSLFKDKVFLFGTLVGSVMFAMLMSVTFLLPVFMQELLHFTATQSGVALMPRTLVMMVCIPIVGRLYNKIQPRVSVFLGLIVLAIAVFMMSKLTLMTTAAGVVTALIVQGLGFSLMMVPLSTIALSSIPRVKMTDATGLNSLFRQIGGSIGLAVFANMLGNSAVHARAALAAHVTEVNPDVLGRLQMVQGGMISRGMDAFTAHAMSIAMMAGTVAQQAMVLAFQHVFTVGAIALLCILPLAYFLKEDPDSVPHAPGEGMHVEL